MTRAADAPKEKEAKLGIGLNAGVQKPYCDVLHTGLAPAGEVMMRLLLGKMFNISLSVGGGLLSDGFSYSTYSTTMAVADLKLNINLSSTGRMRPYLSVGASGYSFEYKRNKSWALGLPSNEKKSFTSSAIIVGGGVEYHTSPKFAINMFADYRHTPTDLLDGAEIGKAKDGYLNGRVGFTYYLGGRAIKKQPKPEDQLIALQQGEAGDMSAENKDKLATFEAKLDKLEAGDADLSMESYVRLKSRVDELNQLIESKEKELDDLHSALDFKNRRIADLESSLQKATTGGGAITSSTTVNVTDFSPSYDEALRHFYGRRYSQAIAIFDQLKTKYPNHALASNCQYWVGECYFGMANYQQALDAFQAVFNWAASTKKDDATLMLGRCYLNLNDRDKARGYFQGVISDYPESEYIEKAKAWLNKIG
jgi:tol-pal system protein YbgF